MSASADEQSQPSSAQLTVDDELETWEEWFASLPSIPPREDQERGRRRGLGHLRPRTPTHVHGPRPMSMGLGSGGAHTVPAANRPA
jgi:hypothetical protein